MVIHHIEIGSVHSRLPVDHRLSRRADLRSCCTAFEPPELVAPATMPPGPARGRLRSASSLVVRGRAVLLTHNKDAKLADIRPTAARIAQADVPGRRPDSEIFVRCARRCLDSKYFFPGPCLQTAPPRISCVYIAVLSVLDGLKPLIEQNLA